MDQKNRWIILIDEHVQTSSSTPTNREKNGRDITLQDNNTIGNITILPSPRNGM